MNDRITLSLWEPVQGHRAMAQAWVYAKAWLMAGHRLELVLRPQTRSLSQNARLHAMLGEIAQQLDWAGRRRSIEAWKRLLTAAWLRARGESVELLPAIDGHGVDVVFRHTSRLTRGECAELCDYIEAWAAQQGVALCASDDGDDEMRGGAT